MTCNTLRSVPLHVPDATQMPNNRLSGPKPRRALTGRAGSGRPGHPCRPLGDTRHQRSVGIGRRRLPRDPLVEVLVALRQQPVVEVQIRPFHGPQVTVGKPGQDQVHLLDASPDRAHVKPLAADVAVFGHVTSLSTARRRFSSCDSFSPDCAIWARRVRISARIARTSAGSTCCSSGASTPSPSPVSSQRIDTPRIPETIWSLFARGSLRSSSQLRRVPSLIPSFFARSFWVIDTASRAAASLSPNVAVFSLNHSVFSSSVMASSELVCSLRHTYDTSHRGIQNRGRPCPCCPRH